MSPSFPYRRPTFRLASLALVSLLAACGGGSSDDSNGPAGDSPETDPGTNGPGSASGLRLVSIVGSDADGRTSERRFGWDDDGRLLTETITVDGAVDRASRYDWPDAERFTAREDDRGGDGGADEFVDYVYTPDGQLSGARIDDANGELLGSIQYDFGEESLVESRERLSGDRLVERETFAYDESGQLASESIDNDGDGIADLIRGYRYAENGTVSGTVDTALDGSGQLGESTWTYEAGECIRNWMNSVFSPWCVTFR